MAFFIDSWPEESGSQIFRREPAKGPWLSPCLPQAEPDHKIIAAVERGP